MSSVEVHVVVEGQTEQTFVRDVLAPEMAYRELFLHPVLIGKPGHKGGSIGFDRAKVDIENFLRQRNDTYVTTMFDFVGIDSNWPGKKELLNRIANGAVLTATEKADILEIETHRQVTRSLGDYNAGDRFIPYIEMHEFEALLFSDPIVLSGKLGIGSSPVYGIIEQFDNPEEINDDPASSPCKRLQSLVKAYRKVAMGKAVAEAIGISTMRGQCPHFHDWLTRLETLRS